MTDRHCFHPTWPCTTIHVFKPEIVGGKTGKSHRCGAFQLVSCVYMNRMPRTTRFESPKPGTRHYQSLTRMPVEAQASGTLSTKRDALILLIIIRSLCLHPVAQNPRRRGWSPAKKPGIAAPTLGRRSDKRSEQARNCATESPPTPSGRRGGDGAQRVLQTDRGRPAGRGPGIRSL